MPKRLTRSQQASKDMDRMFKAVGKIARGGKKKRKKSKVEKVIDFLIKK